MDVSVDTLTRDLKTYGFGVGGAVCSRSTGAPISRATAPKSGRCRSPIQLVCVNTQGFGYLAEYSPLNGTVILG